MPLSMFRPAMQFWFPSIAKISNKARQSRHFVVVLGLNLCWYSARISEAQESSFQPGNAEFEVIGKRQIL